MSYETKTKVNAQEYLEKVLPERDKVLHILSTLEKAHIQFNYENNRTTATLFKFVQTNTGVSFVWTTGVAKCNPNFDEFSYEFGNKLAAIRAYRIWARSRRNIASLDSYSGV